MSSDFTVLWRRKTLWFFLVSAVLGLCCRVGFPLVVASGAFSLAVVHWLLIAWLLLLLRASLVAQMVKNLPAMQETGVRCLGWEDSPGEGNGYPLQYSFLGNLMDRGVWWATVHGIAESDMT